MVVSLDGIVHIFGVLEVVPAHVGGVDVMIVDEWKRV